MAFAMNCTSKGCGKFQEPFIDKNTDKVYCSECEQEMANISVFAKNQMKNLKQFRQKKTAAYAVKCGSCSKTEQPKLKNKDIVCGACGKVLANLSEPFKIILREKLKELSKDV